MKIRNKIICLALVLLMVIPMLAMATSANTATAATIKSVELTLKKKNGSDIPAQYGSVAGITDGDAFDSTRDANDSWPYFYSDWVRNSNIFYYLDQDGKFTESATDENNKYRAYLVIELNDVSKLSDMTIWLGADGSTAENAGAWSDPKLNWNMNEAYDILGSMDGETWVVLDEFDKMCGNKTEKGENFPSEGDADYASKTVDGYLRLGHKIDMKDQTMRYISVAVKKGNNETHNQTGEELHAIFFGEITINGEVTDASAPNYRFAKDGDLLYKANFAGDAYWQPSKENGSALCDRGDVTSENLTVTPDSTDPTMANFTVANASGHNFWGGKVENLYIGEGYNYTVKFTLNAKAAEGFGVLIDGYHGVYVQSGKGRLQRTTQKINDYVSYSANKNDQEFAAEVNGMTISLYVKLADGWTMIDSATISEYLNTNLCLNFYIYNKINTDMSNLEVYKGLAASNLVNDAPTTPENPTPDEPTDTEPTDTEPTDTTPTDTQPTTPPETFAPPKPVTDAPTETSGDTGAAEESGCASLISGAGIVAAVTGVAALAFASKKRKED